MPDIKQYKLIFSAHLLNSDTPVQPYQETVLAETEWQAMTELYKKYDQVRGYIVWEVKENEG